MIYHAYTLLDSKSGVYSPPFFATHDVMAVRIICDLSRDLETTPAKYPSDFVLYRVGLYDDGVGTLASVAPDNLGSVAAIVARNSNGSD